MGIENRPVGGVGSNETVWTTRNGGRASLKNVLDAFRDPNFSGFAATPPISGSVRALSDGATRGEILDFGDAVRSVPGASEALDRALARVAPHLY